MVLPFIALYIALNVLICEMEDAKAAYLHEQWEWEQEMLRDYRFTSGDPDDVE